jgi:hypothetical protein
LKEKKHRKEGFACFIHFETIEYARRLCLFRSTACLQTFFDTEKENLLGVDASKVTL